MNAWALLFKERAWGEKAGTENERADLTLRFLAMCRHYSQAAGLGREWVPEKHRKPKKKGKNKVKKTKKTSKAKGTEEDEEDASKEAEEVSAPAMKRPAAKEQQSLSPMMKATALPPSICDYFMADHDIMRYSCEANPALDRACLNKCFGRSETSASWSKLGHTTEVSVLGWSQDDTAVEIGSRQ